MTARVEPAILITLRAYVDRSDTVRMLISLRSYTLGDRVGLAVSAEFADPDEALSTVRAWLEEFRADGKDVRLG